MGQTHDYSLTTREIAEHFSLSARTVRDHLQKGHLRGVRINKSWRCRWADVWAAENGPPPKGARAACYKEPLLKKKDLGDLWKVSERTVERWIEQGLPTRNVFGSVRIARIDADEWVQRMFSASA